MIFIIRDIIFNKASIRSKQDNLETNLEIILKIKVVLKFLNFCLIYIFWVNNLKTSLVFWLLDCFSKSPLL